MRKNLLHTFLSLMMVGWGVTGFSQTYCVTSPTIGNSGDIITKVSLTNAAGANYTNTTTYSTATPAYYTSYANTPLALQTGTSNTLAITFGTDATQYSAAWIDFNRDGIFQASENIALATTSSAGSTTKTYTFSIPATATLGTTTLRVRGGSDDAYTTAGACTASDYGETEDYKVTITAPPAPSCAAPTAVTSSNITDSTARVSFTAPATAPGNGYDYFITTANTAPASGATPSGHVSASPINLTGSFSNSPVYVWVRSSCSATDNSAVAATPAYIDPFCMITGSTSNATYLNSFQTTGGITNISSSGTGFSTGGYLNGTSKVVTQNIGSSVTFLASITGGTVGVGVWIDWNDNDVFSTNEKVYSSGSNYVSTAAGSFTVPAAALPGKHRLRVVVDYNTTTPTACGLSAGRGEVEDYTFIVPVKPPTVAGTATICPGATTPITASGCSGTITWSNGATGASAIVPAGSYTATCTIDEVTSAASTAVVVSSVPLTIPSISGAQTVCAGATTTLSAGNCGGTITWSNGATGASISAPGGSYTATCTMNGCVSAPSAAHMVTTTNVTTPTITAGATNCPAGTATLTASNYTGNVIWSNGATGASITAPAGSYSAMSSQNGCLSASSNTATVAPCPTCPMSANLLVNGSFEEGIVPLIDFWKAVDQPGWKEISNGNDGLIETWKAGVMQQTAPDGVRIIELNNKALGIIEQDVTVTPNQPLTLSYHQKARGTTASESLRADVIDLNTNQVIDTLTSTVSGSAWSLFTTTFTPTSDKIGIRFTSLNASDDGADVSLGNLFDDVSLNYSACICTTPFMRTGDGTACANSWDTLATTGCNAGSVSWDLSNDAGTHVTLSSSEVWGFLGIHYVASCTIPGCPTTTLPMLTITEDPSCSGTAQARGVNNALITGGFASVSVAPNPVRDAAAVKLSGFANGAVSIQIVNVNGAVVSTTKYENVNGENISLNMSSLGAGMYFIKAEQAGKVATVKVVKH